MRPAATVWFTPSGASDAQRRLPTRLRSICCPGSGVWRRNCSQVKNHKPRTSCPFLGLSRPETGGFVVRSARFAKDEKSGQTRTTSPPLFDTPATLQPHGSPWAMRAAGDAPAPQPSAAAHVRRPRRDIAASSTAHLVHHHLYNLAFAQIFAAAPRSVVNASVWDTAGGRCSCACSSMSRACR